MASGTGVPVIIQGCHLVFLHACANHICTWLSLNYTHACISFPAVLLPVNKIRKHSFSKVSTESIILLLLPHTVLSVWVGQSVSVSVSQCVSYQQLQQIGAHLSTQSS